jgi:hypothetical protein
VKVDFEARADVDIRCSGNAKKNPVPLRKLIIATAFSARQLIAKLGNESAQLFGS